MGEKMDGARDGHPAVMPSIPLGRAQSRRLGASSCVLCLQRAHARNTIDSHLPINQHDLAFPHPLIDSIEQRPLIRIPRRFRRPKRSIANLSISLTRLRHSFWYYDSGLALGFIQYPGSSCVLTRLLRRTVCREGVKREEGKESQRPSFRTHLTRPATLHTRKLYISIQHTKHG